MQSPLRAVLAWISLLSMMQTSLCFAQTSQGDRPTKYLPASVKVAPGLKCKLHAPNSGPESGITVFTDGDGYARFHAVRGGTSLAGRSLTLSCTDTAGRTTSYPVDLTAEEVFSSHPLDLAKEPGIDRPPLAGDPMSYTKAQLTRQGYGLRPDPDADPKGYVSWLEAAKKHGRMLHTKRTVDRRHTPRIRTPITKTGPITTTGMWLGALMGGSPSYVSIQAIFYVPTASPGADGTTSTAAMIWPGLGGYYDNDVGPLQAGIEIDTTPTAASYYTWREYCCGNPNSDGYAGDFDVTPGDKILVQVWYCDAEGNNDINGGYGCNHIFNHNTGAALSCTLPKNDPSNPPCWSVPALPLCSNGPSNCMTLGTTAEFAIEDVSDQISPPTNQFPVFSPSVAMLGTALTTTGAVVTVDNDGGVTLMADFPHDPPHITVTIGDGATSFSADAP
jgi:hypothetical protein